MVGLTEVYNSERILACRSLIMEEDVNFWEEDLKPDNPCDNVQKLMQEVDQLQIEIQESSLYDDSRDVATGFPFQIFQERPPHAPPSAPPAL